jgi:hypothetical protein
LKLLVVATWKYVKEFMGHVMFVHEQKILIITHMHIAFFQPLPIPTLPLPWSLISMGFIVDIPHF